MFLNAVEQSIANAVVVYYRRTRGLSSCFAVTNLTLASNAFGPKSLFLPVPDVATKSSHIYLKFCADWL